jgi:organic hydroperoxide reductase OsmC/OhrA
MKFLVVYYSYTENNCKIARLIRQKLNCDIMRIEELKKRTSFTILFDVLLNRFSSIKTDVHSLREASLGCIEVATPPEFPKGIPGIWSPEHLFTASVASCFMTTFLSVAENSKLDFGYFTCYAKGKLESVDGKLMMTEIQLFPEVNVPSDVEKDKAQKVLGKAEQLCLIIRAKVLMIPTVIANLAGAAKEPI